MLSLLDQKKFEALGLMPLQVNGKVVGIHPCVESLIKLSNATKLKAIKLSNVCALLDGGLVIPIATVNVDGDRLEPITHSIDIQRLARCQDFTSIDLSNVYIENTGDSYSDHSGCSNLLCGGKSLIKVDASNLDTSRVRYMNSMFDGCASLVSLDLSNFDTSRVTDMSRMFAGCKELRYLNLSNFDTTNLGFDSTRDMFYQCKNLRRVIINRKKNPIVIEQLYKNATDYHINNFEIVEHA